MAGSVNKVILVGNLGRDPKPAPCRMAARWSPFPIATGETWTDKGSGERKERTQWHRIVIYNDRLGEIAERYLKKGAKIYIEGQLETRKFTDKDGNERETTEVVLRQFRGELTMLDGRNEGGGEQSNYRERPSPRRCEPPCGPDRCKRYPLMGASRRPGRRDPVLRTRSGNWPSMEV